MVTFRDSHKDYSIKTQYLTLTTSVFITALCGIVYELLLATAASYLLGDTILQFSIVIGLFLSPMGLGSYLSKFIHINLMEGFLLIELAIGIIGGISIFILFGSYSFFPDPFRSTLYGSIILIGIGVGLEIPLLTRLMGRYGELKDTLARALSFDYIGALVASITFPLFFYPKLGLMRTFF